MSGNSFFPGTGKGLFFMSNEEMEEFDCPWCGRGASLDITGCRFVLCPMSDRYIDIILDLSLIHILYWKLRNLAG